jgi:thiol-disulfide isomerase/thioredoxin/DNA-binding beta-propeller fold protein YncE
MPRLRAPELPQNLPWLNSQPLSLSELRGRYVLLDFWTYGCINCLHVLPDLNYLEQQYADQLTVIGIHAGKFDREKELDNIRQAVQRYNIQHPVLVDSDFKAWDQYAVKAYPTFVLIDPQGYIINSISGEGKREILERSLQQRDIPGGAITPTLPMPTSTPLRFPGNVLATFDRLFISDSGHDRILISTLTGEVITTIGQSGFRDGTYDQAAFSNPQGLAYADQKLYVADSGNHAIRCVDLVAQQVTTIAGTGRQSSIIYPHGGWALETDLNSPWDVVAIDETIWIAMAGSHQIWQLQQGHIMTYAGSGAEGCFDGSTATAAFAQPSGLATDGKTLFVADSETSSIRAIDLTHHTVQTICGSGDLYGFGDVDGVGDQVRLQHCLALDYDSELWVADTYNHKIKRIRDNTCETVLTGFAEPSGLSLTATTIYVADTNHHAIWSIDRATLAKKKLEFLGLCAPELCWR